MFLSVIYYIYCSKFYCQHCRPYICIENLYFLWYCLCITSPCNWNTATSTHVSTPSSWTSRSRPSWRRWSPWSRNTWTTCAPPSSSPTSSASCSHSPGSMTVARSLHASSIDNSDPYCRTHLPNMKAESKLLYLILSFVMILRLLCKKAMKMRHKQEVIRMFANCYRHEN